MAYKVEVELISIRNQSKASLLPATILYNWKSVKETPAMQLNNTISISSHFTLYSPYVWCYIHVWFENNCTVWSIETLILIECVVVPHNIPISCCFFCKKNNKFLFMFLWILRWKEIINLVRLSFGDNCCLDCLFRSMIECPLCMLYALKSINVLASWSCWKIDKLKANFWKITSQSL